MENPLKAVQEKTLKAVQEKTLKAVQEKTLKAVQENPLKAVQENPLKAVQIKHSAIYRGWLRHRRFFPRQHQFRYQVFMMYLDLAELDQVLALSPWWSKQPWSPARFVREDFLGGDNSSQIMSLDSAVRRRIQTATGVEHRGPIRMLANLRYFGVSMNPMVNYYCFDDSGQLVFMVAEVTNTPWRERHSYVLRCDPSAKQQRIQFSKRFFVSPFNPMAMVYNWLSNTPGEKLALHIETRCDTTKVMDATLALRRQEISAQTLDSTLWQYPWMTAKVAVSIYWQALRLWLKKVPVYAHPNELTMVEGYDNRQCDQSGIRGQKLRASGDQCTTGSLGAKSTAEMVARAARRAPGD